MCASAESSRIRSMPLFARPELAFIIGSLSFCKKRVRAYEIPHKGKPPICWRMITEKEYGFMTEGGAGEVSFPRGWFRVLCLSRNTRVAIAETQYLDPPHLRFLYSFRIRTYKKF